MVDWLIDWLIGQMMIGCFGDLECIFLVVLLQEQEELSERNQKREVDVKAAEFVCHPGARFVTPQKRAIISDPDPGDFPNPITFHQNSAKRARRTMISEAVVEPTVKKERPHLTSSYAQTDDPVDPGQRPPLIPAENLLAPVKMDGEVGKKEGVDLLLHDDMDGVEDATSVEDATPANAVQLVRSYEVIHELNDSRPGGGRALHVAGFAAAVAEIRSVQQFWVWSGAKVPAE